MKNIAVLGAGGSIGLQTVDVIERSEGLCLFAIALDKNIETCAYIANKHKPRYIAMRNEAYLPELRANLSYSPIIFTGDSAAAQLCALPETDIVVNAVSGIAGFLPLVTAIENGKTVAAANKESIVCAHSLFGKYFDHDERICMTKPFPSGAKIIPVDSEQSAIFRCLIGENKGAVDKLILTASGGAFYGMSTEELQHVTAEASMTHPTWKMGKKITIDSATLFNKGLEVMEAAYLFGMSADEIEVCIHRQSVVHSMVRFTDGSVKAQLAVPDMRCAIQYALSYPECPKASIVSELSFSDMSLTFQSPDTRIYRSLPLAYDALRAGGAYPIVYNAANEAAVELFVNGKIGFLDIFDLVESALSKEYPPSASSIDDVMEIDRIARAHVNA